MSPTMKPLWVRWWPSHALDGMMDLTAMEELAYRRILDLIFKSDDHLRDDDRVMPNATKTGRQWRAIKAALIAKDKIEIAEGFIRNGRATETCIETRNFRAQRSAAASASHGDGKRLKDKDTSPAEAGAGAPPAAPAAAPARQQTTVEEESGGAASARKADPAPGLPLGPVVVAAEVVQIIDVFDASRTAAFPSAAARFPTQTDRIDAGRWLKAGIEAGMTPGEVVQICGDVFTAVHAKLAARSSQVPRSLAFHDQDIADAFARQSQPLPAGNPTQPRVGKPAPGAGLSHIDMRIAQLQAMKAAR